MESATSEVESTQRAQDPRRDEVRRGASCGVDVTLGQGEEDEQAAPGCRRETAASHRGESSCVTSARVWAHHALTGRAVALVGDELEVALFERGPRA